MKKLTKNARETQDLAGELHRKYPEHKIWLLYGDLGSGKTTFTKGLGEALAMDPKIIKSPTFTFVSEYPEFTHYDLYRLEHLDELTLALLEEHQELQRPLVIEWPEKVENAFSQPHLKIYFEHQGEDQRLIRVEVFPPSEG